MQFTEVDAVDWRDEMARLAGRLGKPRRRRIASLRLSERGKPLIYAKLDESEPSNVAVRCFHGGES